MKLNRGTKADAGVGTWMAWGNESPALPNFMSWSALRYPACLLIVRFRAA